MALFDKENLKLWLGIGIGVGVAAAPALGPVLAAIGRPLLKAVIGQSLVAGERLREGVAHFSEMLTDVVAEVKAEAEQRALMQREALAGAVNRIAAENSEKAKTSVKSGPN